MSDADNSEMIPHSCMRGLRLLLSCPDNESMVLAARCLHLHSSSAEQVWRASHLKIAPPAIWQQWACPTALPSLDVLDHAGMRGLSLKGEPQDVLHNRKCPNSCQQHCLGTPITITAFTLNRSRLLRLTTLRSYHLVDLINGGSAYQTQASS